MEPRLDFASRRCFWHSCTEEDPWCTGSFCSSLLPCQSTRGNSNAHLAEVVLQGVGVMNSSQGLCIPEVAQLTFCFGILCLYLLHFLTLPLLTSLYCVCIGSGAEIQYLVLVLRSIQFIGRYRTYFQTTIMEIRIWDRCSLECMV